MNFQPTNVVSEASEQFLDLATKPLSGNHEQLAHANWEISSKLKPEMGNELNEASKRLETSDRSKWKPTRIGLVLFILGIGFLGLSAYQWLPKYRIAKYMLGFRGYVSSEKMEDAKKLITKGLPVRDQMLVENQFEKLQNLYPSEPLYFAPDFQHKCLNPNESINFQLDLIDRISKNDPDNGWWSYSAACGLSWRLDWIDDPGNGNIRKWESSEQEKVDLILLLLRKAAAAPRFDSYQAALFSRKIAIPPAAETVQDCFMNGVYVSASYVGRSGEYPSLDHLVITQSQQLADRKDISGFKTLLNDWIKLTKAKAIDFNEMNDLYHKINSLTISLPAFLTSAQQLELHEEVRAIKQSIAILDKFERPYPTNKANQQALRFHGSFLTSTLAPRSSGDCGLSGDYFHGRYPPMTKERLKPNRRSEYSYIAQLLVLPLALLMLAASACFFILSFRNGRLCRQLSGRFTGLFDRSDWFICLGFGVLLPMLYFAIIRYFTPFGGLDWCGGNDGRYLEYARFLLLFILIVSCSLLVLRWRLRIRMSFFELNERRGKIGLILTIAGFAILPVLGSCFQTDERLFVKLNMSMIYPCAVVMGFMMIWLITLTFRALLGNPEQALRRHILARVMARTMICAFALVCATLPLHRAEEKFWMKRDTVIRADPVHPAFTRYEWEVIQLMKSELLETLAPLDAISQ